MEIKCLIPKRHIIAALLLLISVLGVPSLRAQAIPLGKLDGWWRYTTLQGTLLKSAAQFQTVPAYLTDPALSFPYQRRINPSTGEPYAKEMLFADGLYLVRPIGGWDPDAGGEASDYRGDISLADVWYRTPANGLAYRWYRLFDRLDPVVSTYGYANVTLVLDNIPWSLPAPGTAALGSLGQKTPAQYPSWLYWSSKQMCIELTNRYGSNLVNQFRFRMGTEYNDERRFNGTLTQYLQMHDWCARGVRESLPNVPFGPFNGAGDFFENDNVLPVAGHCANGTNYATGGTGAPFAFASTSLYFIPHLSGTNIVGASPLDVANARKALWDAITQDFPGLPPGKKEIHEFGVLGSEVLKAGSTTETVFTWEPGARGAAQRFHTLVYLLQYGCRRIQHWDVDVSERFSNGTSSIEMLTGLGWLYSIFDHFRGSNVPIYRQPVFNSSANGTEFVSMVALPSNKVVVLVSAYNQWRNRHQTHQVTVLLPKNWFAGRNGQIAKLDRKTAFHDVVRADLSAANLLHTDYQNNPDIIAHVSFMAGARGDTYVMSNLGRYEGLIQNSLTLRPLTAADGSLTDYDTTRYVLTLPNLPTPSVWAIVFQ
jgi:hypothetical protein